jgi:hypothetical protein
MDKTPGYTVQDLPVNEDHWGSYGKGKVMSVSAPVLPGIRDGEKTSLCHLSRKGRAVVTRHARWRELQYSHGGSCED